MAKSIDEVIESRGLTSEQVSALLLEFVGERKLASAARDFLATGFVTDRWGRAVRKTR